MSEQSAGSQPFLAGLFKNAKNKPQFADISQQHIFFGMILCLLCIEIGTLMATPYAKAGADLTNLFVCVMLLTNILSSQFSWNRTGTVIIRLASYFAMLAAFVRLYFVFRYSH